MEESVQAGPRERWIEPEIVEMSTQESESGTAGKSDHVPGNSYKHSS